MAIGGFADIASPVGSEATVLDAKDASFNPDKLARPGAAVAHDVSELVDPDKLVETGNAEGDDFEDNRRLVSEAYNPDRLIEPPFTTRQERIDRTPGDSYEPASFVGERGDSDAVPNLDDDRGKRAADKLAEYGVDRITYKDGIVDFSPVAEATVTIDDMTSSRPRNFAQADRNLAKRWNEENHEGRSDWSQADIRDYRRENELSWHERSDCKTCDLVHIDIHDVFKHPGGVMECKRREGLTAERTFDD